MRHRLRQEGSPSFLKDGWRTKDDLDDAMVALGVGAAGPGGSAEVLCQGRERPQFEPDTLLGKGESPGRLP